MKERLGALLCVGLGAVLITTGLTDSSGATVGLAVPSCGAPAVIGAVAVISCPTGTIAISETTALPSGATATPPVGGWPVDITSSCLNPGTGLPVSLTVTVPDGGTGISDPLFVYVNQTHATKCTYNLTEHAVAGFTAVFAPIPPVDLPDNGGRTGNDRKVDLTNTAEVPTPTATVTVTPTSPAPSTSTSTSTSSASATETIINDSGLAPTTSAAPIANTGPREQVRSSVYIGIALCLLGFALLFAGSWSRRRGSHEG
jgi:hypothetical protein